MTKSELLTKIMDLDYQRYLFRRYAFTPNYIFGIIKRREWTIGCPRGGTYCNELSVCCSCWNKRLNDEIDGYGLDGDDFITF